MQAPEFKSSGEMSESAVAGLVCGIFAVVVLIVVVVVSRKVIVANAVSLSLCLYRLVSSDFYLEKVTICHADNVEKDVCIPILTDTALKMATN